MILNSIRRLALGTVLIAGLTGGVIAQEAAQTVAFTNVNVIDGVSSAIIPEATVVVSGGKIVLVGAGGADVPAGARVIDLEGRYMLPGLIDAHVHIRSFASARRALMSGVTTVRSMGVGFADVGLRELAKQGAIESPEIIASGYHIRPIAAEGFFLDEPSLSYLMKTGVHGEEAVRTMVGAMVDHDVDWIKTNATERAGLPNTDPRVQTFSETELRALVAEADRLGVPVAAHAHGDEGGRAAVAAGVKSIEHGTYLSESTLELMAERGTYLVPTIAVVADLTMPGGDYDDPVLEVRGRHMLPRVREMAAAAHRMGIPIVAATDTGYGSESTLRLSEELIELVGIGLTPLAAIQSATSVAAELIGVDDHTGRIAGGYDADLLIVEKNPLDDIGQIRDPLIVINDGRIVLSRLAEAAASDAS